MHRACKALVFPLASAGRSIPAKMAMMATTTSSSMRVKASREEERVKVEGFIARIRRFGFIQLPENETGNVKSIGLKRFMQSWHSTGRYLLIPEATF